MMRVVVLLLSVAIAACREVAMVPEPVEGRLLRHEAWAGEEVRIVTFSGAGLPVIVQGADTLPVRRVDDSTFAARLSYEAGDVTLSVTGEGLVPAALRLTSHGLVSVMPGPTMTGWVNSWADQLGLPLFLANGDTSLLLVNAATGNAQSFPRSLHDPRCIRQPGTAPGVGQVVLLTRINPADWACAPRVVGLVPGPVAIESVAASVTNRLLARVGPAHWVSGWHHVTCVAPQPRSVGAGCIALEEIQRVRLSPRGDGFTALHNYNYEAGVPVWSTQTGEILYRILRLDALGGAAWTAAGDSLYLVGRVSGPSFPPQVGVVEITQPLVGTQGRTLDLGSDPDLNGYLADAAVSVDGRRLFVLSGYQQRPLLLVVDRRSMTLEARVEAPRGVRCLNRACFDLQLILSDGEVFAVETSGTDYLPGPSAIYRFSLKSPL